MRPIYQYSSVDTARDITADGATLLTGEALSTAFARLSEFSGAESGTFEQGIEMGVNLLSTSLYYSKRDSIQTIFDALEIKPNGSVQIFCYDLDSIFEMPAEQMPQLYDMHLRPRLYDYMIKDSSNRWCVVINHSGGVMQAET